MAMPQIVRRFNLQPLTVVMLIAFFVLLLMYSYAHPQYTPSLEILERTRLILSDQSRRDGIIGDGESGHSGAVTRTTTLVTGGKRRPPRHRGGKPWYITGGDFFPTHSKNCIPDNRSLWYDGINDDDRIVDQLMYTIDDPINVDFSISSAKNFTEEDPVNVDAEHSTDKKIQKIIKIFFRGGWYGNIEAGRLVFLRLKCPVNACRIVTEYNTRNIPDVVVLSNNFIVEPTKYLRRPEQLWIAYESESPFHAPLVNLNVPVNLTATYRRDSDIARPYGKWVQFDEPVAAINHSTNFAAGKSKKVAMFVSNCHPKNNRNRYAQELGKHIQVDIYGKCGTLSCPNTPVSKRQECFEMLSKDYKFYLAFENSNCRDYITEKFFQNGLGNLVVPIVMGAHPNDYARSAPPHSYIHVDDFSSPEELANYLHKLDKDDYLYNQYFKWRVTGELISTHIFCRFCAMAHYVRRYPKNPSYYQPQDLITKWWKQEHVCTYGSWKSVPDIFA